MASMIQMKNDFQTHHLVPTEIALNLIFLKAMLATDQIQFMIEEFNLNLLRFNVTYYHVPLTINTIIVQNLSHLIRWKYICRT